METGIVKYLLNITLLGSEWILWLLVATSIASIAIMIERARAFRKTAIDFDAFRSKVEELLKVCKYGDLKQLCEQNPSLEALTVTVALDNLDAGGESIEKSTSGALINERRKLEKGMTTLATLGNNAPFIGLFGTVIGIIKAFHDLSANPAGGASVVMSGISEALISTAVGLVVAIPAVIAFNAFQRAVKTKMANAESMQRMLLAHVARREYMDHKESA